MKFADYYNTILEARDLKSITPFIYTLKIGKYTLYKNLSTYHLPYSDENAKKLISTATRNNLKVMLDSGHVKYNDIYIIDKSGQGRLSTYITGIYKTRPFVYARIETTSPGAGRSKIYFEHTWLDATQFAVLISSRELPNGTWKRIVNGNVVHSETEMGKSHRIDGPAIEHANGSKEWWVNGYRHRIDGPAIEHANGSKEWWVNNKLHRMDGPAVEDANGSKEWYVNGEAHRIDGPAIEWIDGSNLWYVNGKQHRSDGPAVEYADGSKQWWVNSHLHRLDGPAIEWLGGGRQWFVNGKEYSEEEFNTIFGGSKDPAILKQRAASNDLFM